jgi:hypothetical protein
MNNEYTQEKLEKLSKEELISIILELQEEYEELDKDFTEYMDNDPFSNLST